MIAWITLLLATLAVAVSSTAKYYQYHIVPLNSTDLCQPHPKGSCFTLSQLSSHINDTHGNVTISFFPGEHLLNWNMTFNERYNITLNTKEPKNQSNSAPRIRCISNSQISVLTTDLFTLQGLEIYGCQLKEYSRHRSGALNLTKTTALIKNCVFISNSAVCKSCRGGALYIKESKVTIDNCTFSNNSAFQGGGIYISNGTVYIIRSIFENNKAENKGGALSIKRGSTFAANSTFKQNRAEKGGAILISKNSDVTTENCVFSDNSAFKGGGIYISKGTVHIIRSILENNKAKYGGALNYKSGYICTVNSIFEQNTAKDGGAIVTTGGIITGTIYKSNIASSGDGGALLVIAYREVNITNSTFDHNTALAGNGGAVAARKKGRVTITGTIFSGNQALNGGAIALNQQNKIIFNESQMVMKDNIADYGGAMYFERSELNTFVHKKNCDHGGLTNITNNTAKIAGGGVYAVQSMIDLNHWRTNIYNNTALQDGGGIFLAASTGLSVDNSLYIIDSNTAQNFGGGIYLQDKSQLLFNYNSQMVLKNNSAKRGGAIYTSDNGSGLVHCDKVTNISKQNTLKECFIQQLFNVHRGSKLKLCFENNSAEETGSDIYGGLLDRCITKHFEGDDTIYELGIDFINNNASFDCRSKTENIKLQSSHISSDPVRVCFCQNNVMDCDYKYPTVSKKKGETFTLSVAVVDQVGKPVNATLISLLLSNDQRIQRLKEGQQLRPVGEHCTELEYNVYSQESSAALEIYAEGPCTNQGISKQEVNITFEPCICSIGLEKIPDPLDCSCDCALELKQYISNCSPENETIQINKNVWIEFINHTNSFSKFITHTCPIDYCVAKPVNISLAKEADQQCAFNRTGRLCGQCEQGLSLVFASSRCQQCSNFYLFLLLPFALAGIALVAFILLLNMTVATGTIHGLIFYANILAANRFVFLPFKNDFLTVFISWLNLDLGIETCFYNGMDSYGKFLLQLVFPAYLFLLIAIIMLLCNHSKRIANLLGKKNPETTLYTLILLSYSKLIGLIITALQKAHIDYPNGQETFWLYDANVPYFTASQIPRFLAMLIVTIVGAVYTTLLLFGQLFHCCSEHRLMKWTTHKYYIHFLKAHHTPLSDKHRYWVGLLLLARLIHCLISAFVDDSKAILSVSALTTLLLLHKTNNQIYNNWLLSKIETIFIANLSILAVASLYIKSVDNVQEGRVDQQVLITVSMSISFIIFLGIVLYHILDTCGVRLSKLPNTILTALKESRHNQPVIIIEGKESDNYELLDQHDDDQLREPALDDLIPVRPEDYNRPPTPPPQCKEPTFTEINIRAA